MFERYTEAARRVVFFARYQAAALGGPSVDAWHFLLALIKESAPLLERYVSSPWTVPAMRDRLLDFAAAQEVTPADVDLPFFRGSQPCPLPG